MYKISFADLGLNVLAHTCQRHPKIYGARTLRAPVEPRKLAFTRKQKLMHVIYGFRQYY